MGKETFIILLLLVVTPLVLSEVGPYKTGDDVNLTQTCNNCTYGNLTSIKYPNSTIIFSNIAMTQNNKEFYYTLSGNYTDPLGLYTYCYDVGNSAESSTGCIFFRVTRTGEQVGLSNIVLPLVLLVIAGLFLALSYNFSKDKKWLMKSFFIIMSIGMIILSINSANIVTSESSNLNKMGNAGLLIAIVTILLFLLYIFVYAFKEIIGVFKKKGDLRWGEE